MNFLTRFKPKFWDHPEDDEVEHVSFRRMWFLNFTIASAITLLPVTLIFIVGLIGLAEPDSLRSIRPSPGHLGGLYVSLVILLLALVYKGTVAQVSRVYRAHLEQSQILREVVYTQKLASIGRLAEGVAHQINNPLAVINEKTGLMKDLIQFNQAELDRDRLLGLVGDILGEIRRAGQTTHRLLGLTRRLPVEAGAVRLDLLVQEVGDFLVSDLEHRLVEFRLTTPPEGVEVESDQSLLEQILLNILNNSVSAVGEEGLIQVDLTHEPDGFVRMTIRDDGRGISEDDLKHIFEPYFTTKGELGSGLGLYITHGLVEQLGGTVEVTSHLGQGTTFDIRLPESHRLETEPEEPLETGRSEGTDDSGAGSAIDRESEAAPRILFVDDEEEYGQMITERLGIRGIEVDLATEGREALEKISQGTYAGVVLDMMMPGLGGLDALKIIVAQYPGLKVILQTGFATPEMKAKATGQGALAVMEKPVNLDRLIELITDSKSG